MKKRPGGDGNHSGTTKQTPGDHHGDVLKIRRKYTHGLKLTQQKLQTPRTCEPDLRCREKVRTPKTVYMWDYQLLNMGNWWTKDED